MVPKKIFSKLSIFLAISYQLSGISFIKAQTIQEKTQAKLTTYFSKDHAVKDYVGITKDSLMVFNNALARSKNEKPEIAISWKQVEYLSAFIDTLPVKELKNIVDSVEFYMAKNGTKSKSPNGIRLRKVEDRSLSGLKVAIDPGHIGGTYSMGEAESRCMTLHCDSNNKFDSIRLIEGNFTFFTALLLKKKLELQGAEVMLTRKDTGLSSLDITYNEWKQRIKHSSYIDSLVKENLLPPRDIRLLRLRLKDKVLFEKVFGSVDMAERAKKINEFHPDISVVIHYNVNEQNIGWVHPTDKDFVMTFVGGCVVSKDLETTAGRLNFLRLLISPDIENSIAFSSRVIHYLSTDLGVPVAHKEDATYLSKNCISTPAEGVYSRDLALTRLIRGTLVYGEALYQDNVKECRLLTANDGKFQGFTYSKRIEIVADDYYKGIVDYVTSLGMK